MDGSANRVFVGGRAEASARCLVQIDDGTAAFAGTVQQGGGPLAGSGISQQRLWARADPDQGG
jgi:hypothetical protein